MISLKEYIDNLDEQVGEISEESKSSPSDPPPVMVMRRKSIRLFPNGQKVALYYVDKLKQYITVPYSDKGHVGIVSVKEEVIEYNLINHLQEVLSTGTKRFVFEDNSSIAIDKITANDLLKVYHSLNEENQIKVLEMAQQSKYSFLKVKDFVQKYTNKD